MTHSLVLEVPDGIYQKLVQIAQEEGKTVEQRALEILEASIRKSKSESA